MDRVQRLRGAASPVRRPGEGSCGGWSRPATAVETETKEERLARWEESWRLDQDYFASLNPIDAERERSRGLAIRATIEAGPDVVNEVVEYVEIWSPDELCILGRL